jgi:predicted outer membrane repeat protein
MLYDVYDFVFKNNFAYKDGGGVYLDNFPLE